MKCLVAWSIIYKTVFLLNSEEWLSCIAIASTLFGRIPDKLHTRGGEGTPIWNRRGCSSEILNLTPKGDSLGVAQAFCDP